MTKKEVKALLDEYRSANDEIKTALKRQQEWNDIDRTFILPLAKNEASRESRRIAELSTLKAAVECALNELTAVQRAAVRNHIIDRKPCERAAREMNYSLRQFYHHYSAALQRLADSNILNEYLSRKESGGKSI